MARLKTPYSLTPIKEYYLDILVKPELGMSPDDGFYTIEGKYNFRPDKLAHDLYGEPSLWYVFMLRNMDLMDDPIFDFTEGLEIRLPSLAAVRNMN